MSVFLLPKTLCDEITFHDPSVLVVEWGEGERYLLAKMGGVVQE